VLRLHHRIRAGHTADRVAVEQRRRGPRAAAEVVAPVDHDADEPRPERRVTAEAAEGPPRLQQGVLHDVLGVQAVAGHAQRDGEGPVLVQPDQRLERAVVPGPRLREQGGLPPRVGVGRAHADAPGHDHIVCNPSGEPVSKG
jgi:hypothetical protein